VAGVRDEALAKAPGIAETLDWVQALCSMEEETLEPETVGVTLGAVLKSHEDLEHIREEGLSERVARAREAGARAG
jgi:aspartate aminotransferase-like enzyme